MIINGSDNSSFLSNIPFEDPVDDKKVINISTSGTDNFACYLDSGSSYCHTVSFALVWNFK
jgi:hypothetical protein